MNKLLLSLLLSSTLIGGVQAQKKENYYVKHVEFPQDATLEQKVDMAARLVPATICLATNGTDRFPSFWHQHFYRT